MLRILVLVIVLGSLAGCSREEGRGGFVYELSKGDESFFLGGTIHVLTKEYRKVDPVYGEVMGKVDRLVCEVDGTANAQSVQKIMTGDGPAAGSALNGEEAIKLDGVLRDFGLDPKMAESMPAHMLVLNIVYAAHARLGASGEYGLDRQLRHRAGGLGVDIVALESAEEQARIFGGMPDDLKLSLLREVLSDSGELESRGAKFLSAWRDGNVADFNERIEDGFNRVPGFVDLVYTGRNLRWVEQIEAIITDGRPTFVAVGGAHLFGQFGLLRLFEGRGWKVQRIDRKGLPDDADET